MNKPTHEDGNRALPKLIFTSSDVTRIPFSDVNQVKFKNRKLETFARRLNEIAVFDRRAETELRAYAFDPESFEQLTNEIEHGIQKAKADVHSLLLAEHSFPAKEDLVLAVSDVYRLGHTVTEISSLPFRSREMLQLADDISLICSFEQQFNNELSNASCYDEIERRAMINSTSRQLAELKEELIKKLIV